MSKKEVLKVDKFSEGYEPLAVSEEESQSVSNSVSSFEKIENLIENLSSDSNSDENSSSGESGGDESEESTDCQSVDNKFCVNGHLSIMRKISCSPTSFRKAKKLGGLQKMSSFDFNSSHKILDLSSTKNDGFKIKEKMFPVKTEDSSGSSYIPKEQKHEFSHESQKLPPTGIKDSSPAKISKNSHLRTRHNKSEERKNLPDRRSHSPSPSCKKSEIFYVRKSQERDLCKTNKQSSNNGSNCGNNRHSSYHPINLVDEAAAAAAIAVAHELNKIYTSRPSSPNNFENSCSSTLPKSHCLCARTHRCTISSSRGSLLGLDMEDRLQRLETDKDSLHRQVSVLSDQIDIQTSKIQDLEKILDDKKSVLESTQDSLSNELLTRSAIETHKLELLTEISSLRLKQATLERENLDLRGRIVGERGLVWDKPPLGSLRSSSPYNNYNSGELLGESGRGRSGSNGSEGRGVGLQKISRPRTPPASAYRRVEQGAFRTLPKRNTNSVADSSFIQNYGGFQIQGTPLLTPTPPYISNGVFYPGEEIAPPKNKSPGPSCSGGHKSRGIMRILHKLKRSNSAGVDHVTEDKNQRNYRSTTTPRMGWANECHLRKPDGPISSWDSDGVVLWLNYIGLEMYSNEVKRWVKTGQQLLEATPKELEKELGMKNGLHRKKLSLALESLNYPNEMEGGGRLDFTWVIRWLDDIGLPQYKDSFASARIDGRLLCHLTLEDLGALKVTNSLHHLSIKRAIHLLRIYNFHPGCLSRRENSGVESSFDSAPEQIATWTNHRIMEWLKLIDLAEYAPNLRGSGVHGALIILEPKFNAELLASILSIPANKTLLRRHLCLQLNELIGRDIMQEKRSVEIDPSFTPISPTLKVKIPKQPKFKLRKRRGSEVQEELICPFNLNSFPKGVIKSESYAKEQSRAINEIRSPDYLNSAKIRDKTSNI